MSDSGFPIGFADSAQAALDASKSAGQVLREAREAQGLHVAALAVALKVPVKKLEALEDNRLEDLPDAVFVRALASSVCRSLKIDPAPVLAKLPDLNKRVLDQIDSGLNVAFRAPNAEASASPVSRLSKPVMLGVMALLLAAIVILALPQRSDVPKKLQGSIDSVVPNLSGSTVGGPNNNGVSMGAGTQVLSSGSGGASLAPANGGAQTSPMTQGAQVSPSPSVGAATATTAASATASTTRSTPTLVSPSFILTPSSSAATPTVPANSILVFTATGETWVEVRDADDRIMLQRTLQSGQKVGLASGKLPLNVVVGRAYFTQLTVRDKAFDMRSYALNDGVARFQIK